MSSLSQVVISSDQIAVRDASAASSSNSTIDAATTNKQSATAESRRKWISLALLVSLVLCGSIIGVLFGLKVIGGGSASSSSPSSSTPSGSDQDGTLARATSKAGIPAPPPTNTLTYGTYYNPFPADSPWNSRPLNPMFDTYVIPPDNFPPAIGGGVVSTRMFYAVAADKPLTVIPGWGLTGIANADIGGNSPNITIPRWPALFTTTANQTIRADLYDEVTGKIHSFSSLVMNMTIKAWTATAYAWTHVNGTGFGDPAHFNQGQRPSGVSSAAGLIRAHEVNDGLPYFRHALTMTLPYAALSRTPAYVYPATSSNSDASSANYGVIPLGALMMLPPTFNTTTIKGAPLRKIAETLKRYGAYVTDRSPGIYTGNPFTLSVENNSTFLMSNVTGMDPVVTQDLYQIRLGLRRVLNATQWLDGYDRTRAIVAPGRPNLLSMRGPWVRSSGTTNGDFDTQAQALVFTGISAPNATKFTQTAKTGIKSYLWANPTPYYYYTFSVTATGGATLQLQVMYNNAAVVTSPILGNGGQTTFMWPATGGVVYLTAWSGINIASSQVAGQLVCTSTVAYDTNVGKFVPPPRPSPAASAPFPDPVGLPKLNFGTYLTPFNAASPWNSRPLNPVLEAPLVPIDAYFPAVSAGAFSTQIFRATAADPSLIVYPTPNGISNPDLGMAGSAVTIPHWPAATTAASGSDGHCDIYDETTGIIHSFWQLVQNKATLVWTAALYSWSHVNGTGWGDPVHYYQGPRATGIPSGAGLIRTHERDDGLPFFRHALTLSLTYSALSGSPESGGPGYVFPATSADGNLTRNYGHIPEGALLMLPPSFDVSQIRGWPLRKVAETLKRFGAYVTDRNDGTPFNLYVENGAGSWKLSNTSGWDNNVAADLQTIRASLSRVLSATSWVDGNGVARAPLSPGTPNLFSMRGPWARQSGTGTGDFSTWNQSVIFPQSTTTATKIIEGQTHAYIGISWAKITPGASLIYIVHAKGGATLELQFLVGGKLNTTSGALGDGQSWSFTWPNITGVYYNLLANSGINQPSSVWCEVKYKVAQPFSFATGSYYAYP